MSLTLDFDDDLIARSVQIPASCASTPPSAPIKSLEGLASTSSIKASTTEVTLPQHRPALPEPEMNAMWAVMSARAKNDQLTSRIATSFKKEVNETQDEMDKLSEEQAALLKKEAEAQLQKDTWDTLYQFSQYVTSGVLIGSSYAVGGVPGWLLWGAGALGLGTRVLEDTGTLEKAVAWMEKSEEKQQKLLREVELGITCIQLGLACASGIGAWQSGALLAGVDGLQVAGRAASTITSVASASTGAAKEFYAKEMANQYSRLTQIKGSLTSNSHKLTEDTNFIKRTAEGAQEIDEVVSAAVRKQYSPMDMD